MDISLFMSRSELFMERNAVLALAGRINYITHEKADLHVRILPEEDDYAGMIAGSLPEAAGENLLPDAGLTVFLIGDEVWGAVRSADLTCGGAERHCLAVGPVAAGQHARFRSA